MVEGTPEKLAGGEHAVGVGADREEGRIAQVEETGKPHNHVEANREEDEHARVGGRTHQVVTLAAGDDVGNGRKEQREDEERVDGPIAIAEPTDGPAHCRVRLKGPRARPHHALTFRVPASREGPWDGTPVPGSRWRRSRRRSAPTRNRHWRRPAPAR